MFNKLILKLVTLMLPFVALTGCNSNANTHTHEYVNKYIDSTCTEQGYTLHVCSICGDEYKDNYIALKEHEFVEDNFEEPTCVKEGIVYLTCVNCGYQTTEILEKRDHEWSSEWIIDIEPTYETEGSKSHHCIYCDEKIDITVVPKLEHYSEGLLYKHDAPTGSYYVSGIGSCTDTDLVFPETYNNVPVTGIAPYAFYNNSNITSLKFSKNISTIGTHAFRCCNSLKELNIPDNITFIYDGAFRECNSLKKVTIGNGIGILSGGLFLECKELEEVILSDSITEFEAYLFYGCSKLKYINFPTNLLVIQDNCFSNCDSLTKIVLPDSVTELGTQAFEECDNLLSVTFGRGLTEIGRNIFYNSKRIVEVINLSSVDYTIENVNYKTEGSSDLIEYNDFEFIKIDGINYLVNYLGDEQDLVFPASYNGESYNIRYKALANNNNLNSITIEDGVINIEELSFSNCANLKKVIIGNCVQSIDCGTFYGSNSIEEMTLPFVGKSADASDVYKLFGYIFGVGSKYSDEPIVMQICDYNSNEFYFCVSPALKKVTINGTKIPDYSFYNISQIEEVVLGENITSIGKYAFCNCNFNSINLSSSLLSIGACAFIFCYNLTSITIPSSLTFIGEDAFSGCYKLVEVINLSSIEIAPGSYGLSALKVKTSGSSDIINNNGYLFYTNEDKFYFLEYTGKEKELTIPYQGYYIYNYAFYKRDDITKITVASDLMDVGRCAFEGCTNLIYNEDDNGYYLGNDTHYDVIFIKPKNQDLETFTFSDNCRTIYYEAFKDCTKLKSVNLKSVQTIGRWAFQGCTALEEVNFEKMPVTIKSYAFYNCTSLKRIYIPYFTERIEDGVFYNCTSLTYVSFPAACTYIGKNCFTGCDALAEANFQNVKGWHLCTYDTITHKYGDYSTSIIVDLNETNAYYLRDKYTNYYWVVI